MVLAVLVLPVVAHTEQNLKSTVNFRVYFVALYGFDCFFLEINLNYNSNQFPLVFTIIPLAVQNAKISRVCLKQLELTAARLDTKLLQIMCFDLGYIQKKFCVGFACLTNPNIKAICHLFLCWKCLLIFAGQIQRIGSPIKINLALLLENLVKDLDFARIRFLWHLVLTKWHTAIVNYVGLSVGPGFATLGTSR